MTQTSLSSLWSRALSAVEDLSQSVRNGRLESALDQELRALDAALKTANEKHNEAKATRIHTQQLLAPLHERQVELEEQATRLLRGHRKKQAQEKAEEIVALAEQMRGLEVKIEECRGTEREIKVVIEETQRQLKLRRYQLGAFRASANLQRTQESLAQNDGENPPTALDALRRLKEASFGTLPSPDDLIGPPPEPVVETSSQVLERLSKPRKNPASQPAKKTASKSRKTS